MMKMVISAAARALLRALIARAGVERDRILLTEARSTDWQSLTFTGERHQISLRIIGADSSEVVERMCTGIEDAEFSIPGLLVADIAVARSPRRALDGSMELVIEALTVVDD
jgi:hypothetical protein